MITLGCAIYALSFNWFFSPNNISNKQITITSITRHSRPMDRFRILYSTNTA